MAVTMAVAVAVTMAVTVTVSGGGDGGGGDLGSLVRSQWQSCLITSCLVLPNANKNIARTGFVLALIGRTGQAGGDDQSLTGPH